MPCQKKKIPTEFLKLNVRLLNTLSKAKYELLQSEKDIARFHLNGSSGHF